MLELHLRDINANSVSPHDWDAPPRNVASLKKEIVLDIVDGQAMEPVDLGILQLTPDNASTSDR